jgi:hypothetical protein
MFRHACLLKEDFTKQKTCVHNQHICSVREFLARYARDCSLRVYTVGEDCDGLLSVFLKSRRVPHSMAVSLSRLADLCVRTAYPSGLVHAPNRLSALRSLALNVYPVCSGHNAAPRSFACFLVSSASNVVLTPSHALYVGYGRMEKKM